MNPVHRRMVCSAAVAFLASAAALAQGGVGPAPIATRRDVRTHFAANLLLEHQFNPVATVTYSDGSKASVGDAILGLNAGAAFPLTSDGRFELQGLAGVAFSKVNATNGSATFWDFPVEVTAHVNVESFRLGAGPVLHISPLLRGDGVASGVNLDFGTTVGATARIEYRFSDKFGFGLHGTFLRLSANGQSADASRLGGTLSLYL